ncbi:uncharacterized protein BYT42DRAFT_611023 [Radiomyces spectabilis]|uniref:uncharacterized protein n=1 Tax=Radiomyces spectabilis TaxID=64574 RepID=UPI00221EB017|nr:uncharacterized protein BYT42DRAFT_611023 [Radiomyces spectabilis]KAI8391843.1 hypothetical protein BYT42DRAFT_611023 [Radiomyces spectabilis]
MSVWSLDQSALIIDKKLLDLCRDTTPENKKATTMLDNIKDFQAHRRSMKGVRSLRPELSIEKRPRPTYLAAGFNTQTLTDQLWQEFPKEPGKHLLPEQCPICARSLVNRIQIGQEFKTVTDSTTCSFLRLGFTCDGTPKKYDDRYPKKIATICRPVEPWYNTDGTVVPDSWFGSSAMIRTLKLYARFAIVLDDSSAMTVSILLDPWFDQEGKQYVERCESRQMQPVSMLYINCLN